MTPDKFLQNESEGSQNWGPTRSAAQARLHDFLPMAGRAYAQKRNFDFGPAKHMAVSTLSPWIRHRCILEEDVLREVLASHDIKSAEKYIQEVLWRGYFKGWLEHRPSIWTWYRQNLVQLIDRLETDAGLFRRYENAVAGQTGIACFDDWATELKETGYLHNHARMWFASIWVFTLELPWELGADFFLRHLLDGDPASNTCSWRWVCGLHTTGKTYLARASNIEKFTDGRFTPVGQLAATAEPLIGPDLPAPLDLSFQALDYSGKTFGLLMTEEDLSIDRLDLEASPKSLLALRGGTKRSVLDMPQHVTTFSQRLISDAAKYAETQYQMPCRVEDDEDWSAVLNEWVAEMSLDCIVTPRLTIGPVRTRLKRAAEHINVPILEITRPYDVAVWPYTKRGFFALKKKIPCIFSELDLTGGTLL